MTSSPEPLALRRRCLHLFALCGFAIAQPILDLVGQAPEFLVVHDLDGARVVFFTATLVVLPPLALTFLELAAAVLGQRFTRALHLALVGLLIAVASLPPLLRTASLPEWLAVLTALGIGVAIAFAYARAAALRQLVGVMALAPIVFAGLFLAHEPVAKLVSAASGEAIDSVGEDAPTIVFIVFDELPLSSLLDEHGQVDRLRYPGFARLADRSTWARGMTTVAPSTMQSLPAILTGMYPGPADQLALRAHHPRSLFSLLESSHVLNVEEPRSRLLGKGDGGRESVAVGGLLVDIGLVYLHIVLPESWSGSLPSIDKDWGGFWNASDSADADQPTRRGTKHNSVSAPSIFRAFAGSIGRIEGDEHETRPGLHFIHAIFPHGPWLYFPKGGRYLPLDYLGMHQNAWAGDPYWADDGYRRHLLQLGLADRLLAELLEALEQRGVLDRSVVAVTADHGMSFWPGESARVLVESGHVEDILKVPFFIKRPFQHEPVVDDRPRESIDILPTVLDAAGIETDSDFDGCSLFDTSCPARAEHTVIRRGPRDPSGSRERLVTRIAAKRLLRRETLERKLVLFGTGERELGLYRFGAYSALAGRPLSEFAVGPGPVGTLRLHPKLRKLREAGRRPSVPARVVGQLVLSESAPVAAAPRVALALDGIVQVVAPVVDERRTPRMLATMLPPDPAPVAAPSSDAGAGLEAYLLDIDVESEDPPRLLPLTLE